MNELALFAGYGGGMLASECLGWRTVCAVEFNKEARRILVVRQNEGIFRPFPIWDDVRTFDGRPWRGVIDIVSGGFPCQAFSNAAAGQNTADDLWPEMRRIVADVAPRFIYAENVSPKAINAAGDDLDQMGYKTRAISISAADLGGDHIRARHWLLAYADDPRELLRRFHAETSGMPSVQGGIWQCDPRIARVSDGLANRMDRLRGSGNGQVPIVAASALLALAESAPWK